MAIDFYWKKRGGKDEYLKTMGYTKFNKPPQESPKSLDSGRNAA